MDIHRRSAASGLLVAAVVLLASGAVAQEPTTAAEVSWTPEEPVQGQLFVVRVAAAEARAVARITGIAAGEALHFGLVESGAHESLAAVPIDAGGSVAMRITVVYQDGSSDTFEPQVPVTAGEYVHERLTVAPRFGAPPNAEDQAHLERDRARAREVSRQAHATPRMWSTAPVLPRSDRVTSGFGDGREFNGRISSRHMGLDLDGDPGDTVVASMRGVVSVVAPFLLAGNVVYLNHGGGLLSAYFHLSGQLVAEGDTVEAGTPIGLVGATGRVTGPHLHWVVRYGSTSVDPLSLPGLPFQR